MQSAMLQHPVPRHSLHNAAASFISQPAPPFEGIVDFTSHSVRPMESSHTHFGPYTASSDLAFQQLPAQGHRVEGAEWKQQSFFTYRPNEVKHRKRTTRQQLKVLEETFKTTQKPDGNVRKALAAQLDMTPRNVQVWFQNRRAKDKTLAKRAQKAADEVQGNDIAANLDESFALQESEQLYSSPGQTYPQEHSFQAHLHSSGSTSPVESTFPQKYEVPTPVHLSQDLTPPSQANSSTSTTFSSLESKHAPLMPQSAYNYSVEQPTYSRDIYAPRTSLPHIHATPYQPEVQHQRSNSSPAFLCNVDTMSNLSLTTCASINGVLYPQRLASNTVSQQSQSMYNSSYPRVPSGPLPSADFSFGIATQNNVLDSERDTETTTTFAPYQYGSVSGTATPSSLSGLSHYGSVASLVDTDDSAVPYGWQPERRGSAPQVYPPNRRSPLSVGYSNSPRAGTTPPTELESDASIYASYTSEWMPAHEESKQHSVPAPIVSADVKSVGGFPQEAPADATFHYMGLLDAQSYNQPLSLANQISGLDVSFCTENLGGFRPIPSGGYFA